MRAELPYVVAVEALFWALKYSGVALLQKLLHASTRTTHGMTAGMFAMPCTSRSIASAAAMHTSAIFAVMLTKRQLSVFKCRAAFAIDACRVTAVVDAC